MSNVVAGEIFQKIIQDVCKASQNDFEENGVQSQALQELQQVWQHKLSQPGVAQMPWDPKPQPPAQPPQQQAPAQAAPQNPAGQPMASHSPVNGQQGANGTPRIKPEPGTENAFPNVPQAHNYGQQGTNQMLAQQRAAHLLHAQFGSQANASLASMQQRGIALPGQQAQQQGPPQQQPQQQQQQRPQGLQLPGQVGQQGPQGQQVNQQQYAQQMRQQQQGQVQPQVKMEGGGENGQYHQGQSEQQSGLGFAQTDGSGDASDEWNKFMAQRRMLSPEQVAQNDHLVRDDVAQLMRELDHGLMVPLDERQRRFPARRLASKKSGPSKQVRSSQVGGAIAQLDGDADLKDEEDEDAINSDLDSSDDEANKEEEDEDEIDSMLCTYDKVQRVKNKWKCVLKDGVLKANGKEYLFHKATGEFEW